ncbi:RET2 protein, partial [Amia calva]|nr:RET2 protein [Amia calva]
MVSNVNLEGYMLALGIYPTIRKSALKLKHKKVVVQKGNYFMVKTMSPFRNYTFDFCVGEEFEEHTKGLDNRKCKESDHLVCVQKGEKKDRGWIHWIQDDKLYLVRLFTLVCQSCLCAAVTLSLMHIIPQNAPSTLPPGRPSHTSFCLKLVTCSIAAGCSHSIHRITLCEMCRPFSLAVSTLHFPISIILLTSVALSKLLARQLYNCNFKTILLRGEETKRN